MVRPVSEVSDEPCPCGNTAADQRALKKTPRYGGWRLFLVLMGISAVPLRVDIQCRRCGTVLDVIDDEAELRQMV